MTDSTLHIIESLNYIGHLVSPCSYLENRSSHLLFLEGRNIGQMYRRLLDAGYRRHGGRLYRPDCRDCQECQVMRVPVDAFTRSSSQKRIWKKGQKAFRYEVAPPEYTPEKEELYRRYLKFQHDREEEGEDDENHYKEFFVDSIPGIETLELRLYHEERLAGIGVLDRMEDSLSSVYFYFEPDFSMFSPGIYTMLLELALARDWGLAYYYPGYYIHECPAMNYKLKLRPGQLKRPLESNWKEIAPGQMI